MTNHEIRLGNLFGATGGSFAGMVYDQKGLCPALNTMGGGQTAPRRCEVQAMKPVTLDRLIPESGKIHQNQEIYDVREGARFAAYSPQCRRTT